MTDERFTEQWLIRAESAAHSLAAYLQLRQAKGYMSTRENDALRIELSELCRDSRFIPPRLKASLDAAHGMALMEAIEAFSSASVCLMTGQHDSPQWIAVDARKLDRALQAITHAMTTLADLHETHEA